MVLAAAWTAYQVTQVRADLDRAQGAAAELLDAVAREDVPRARSAAHRMGDPARAAADRTDGLWWEAMSWAPLLGDDVDGVRAWADSVRSLADGVDPLVAAVARLDHLTVDGRVDLRLVRQLQPLVTRASEAVRRAADAVDEPDSSGYVGALRERYDEHTERVHAMAHALDSGRAAVEVLPAMVGAKGPRTYLLVFENNAEIRATGGLPGSWGLVHARDGLLTMDRQGSGGDVEAAAPGTVLPVTAPERRIFGQQLSHYFRSANATPDFPRAAELMRARWEAGGGEPLDGVIAIDVRGMGYLLHGTGPVPVRGTTLTADNLVPAMLSRAYEVLPPHLQDQAFEEAAKAVFEASKQELDSPLTFLYGLGRAADEGRFRVAAFRRADAEALEGSDVLGDLAGDGGAVPHVDVTLNDATGSKMSYHLRYGTDVEAESCDADGVQTVRGTMRLVQLVDARRARRLPDYVTGGGQYGVEPGTQLVAVRLYAPYGGAIATMSVDGRRVGARLAQVTEQDGRQVATLVAQLSGVEGSEIEWTMTTGPGQTGDVELRVTPSIEEGSENASVGSAC